MSSPIGAGGYGAAHSPDAGPFKKEASWPSWHERECRVLKGWGVGWYWLGKVPIFRTPQCDTIPSRLDGKAPNYSSPLHLLK